jgi:hypothetical protein
MPTIVYFTNAADGCRHALHFNAIANDRGDLPTYLVQHRVVQLLSNGVWRWEQRQVDGAIHL